MLAKIQIYNTLTQKKENLKTLEEGHVRIYACGITTYDNCHIGHAMQAIFFDVIRQYLELVGYKVTYVRNYTDVDDKIIEKAEKLKISPKQLSQQIINSADKDMMDLYVRPADFQPRVSDHITEIIDMIQALVVKKAAYVTREGDVYYRVRHKKDYGKLSNQHLKELRVTTRNTLSEKKEDSLDFALWKKDNIVDASWDSPWGRGRPGWHIECSALAKKFLGESFDIHGGGRDLVFPHHENEIAQSESANGACFATYWMHSGLVTINGQKMSKSLGNHILISDYLKQWDPEVLRLSYLGSHYSSNVDFSLRLFQVTRRRLYYYYQALNLLDNVCSSESKHTGQQIVLRDIDEFKERFHRHMSDNFNTASAIGELNQFFRYVYRRLANRKSIQLDAFVLASCIREIGSVFKILQKNPETFISVNNKRILQERQITEEEINQKIRLRNQARKDNNWHLSDQIREELLNKGIFLQDSKEGTQWLVKDLLED